MEQGPPVQYADYPREPVAPRIRLEAIAEAWKYIKAEMGIWALATFLMLAVTFLLVAIPYFAAISLIMGNRNPDLGTMLAFYGYAFLAMLLGYAGHAIFFAGMYHMAMKQIQGEKIRMGDMFRLGGPSIFSHIGIGIVTIIGVTIGSIACYVPGFIIGGLLMFAQPIVVHQKIGAIPAIRQSWTLLKGQIWMATALYLILSLAASLGSLACLVGILFTYPLFPLTISIVYRDYMQALYGNRETVAAG